MMLMEFKLSFVIVVALLGSCLEVQSQLVSLMSVWRHGSHGVGGRLCFGNLIRISDPSQCNSSTGQCEAKCNGYHTEDDYTRFEVVNAGRDERCIQFTSKSNEKYALKVINRNNIVFEKQDCTTASSEFLFKDVKYSTRRLFFFNHSVSGSFLTCFCDGRDGLYLINSSQPARKDHRIRFRSLL